MVWTVIALFLYLLFPVPAIAEPVETPVESVQDESVDEETSDTDNSDADRAVPDPDKPELQPVPTDNVDVSVPEDTVTYSPTGELLSTTAAPDVVAAPLAFSTPYASVTSNTYSDIAAHMVGKIGWSDNYVFWRSGQYAYTLAYGDIQLSAEGRFTSDSCTIVTFVLDNNYNGTYRMQQSDDESLALDSGTYIVFSNLGVYPVLEYESQKIWYFCLVSVVCAGCYLMRSLFGFVLRMGVRVHGSHES